MKKIFLSFLTIILTYFLISCESKDIKINNQLIKNGLILSDQSKIIYSDKRKMASKSESIIVVYEHDEEKEKIFEKQQEKNQVSYKYASSEEKEKFFDIFKRHIKKFALPNQYEPDLSKDDEYIWQYNHEGFYLVYFENIKRLFVINLSFKVR